MTLKIVGDVKQLYSYKITPHSIIGIIEIAYSPALQTSLAGPLFLATPGKHVNKKETTQSQLRQPSQYAATIAIRLLAHPNIIS